MNVVEKRDYIHSRLHQADEELIDQFYELLCKEEILRSKLLSRAQKSEENIRSGNVLTEEEFIRRTDDFIRR